MYVQNRLRVCVYECGGIECRDAVIRPATVALACGFATEECDIDRGVSSRVMQLRRESEQHSPECGLESVKRLY